MEESRDTKENKKNEEVIGPVVGSIIVILVIIIGGIYFWSLINEKISEKSPINESTNTEEVQSPTE